MLRDIFYWTLGLGILLLNKVRYAVRGYRTPRPFSVKDVASVLEYDTEVVRRWEDALRHAGATRPFAGQRILELGPGADLGVAVLLLAQQATSYAAVDANALATQAPRALYDAFLARFPKAHAANIARELDAFFAQHPSAVTFVHDPRFTLRAIPDASADILVSNAAFEHFDNVPSILEAATRIVAPGGWLCIHVDLQTHTRILRDRDPLNIYRYPSAVYHRMRFAGIPNRVRPAVYTTTLARLGWRDITLTPVDTINAADLPRLSRGVADEFRRDHYLGVLSFVLTARK